MGDAQTTFRTPHRSPMASFRPYTETEPKKVTILSALSFVHFHWDGEQKGLKNPITGEGLKKDATGEDIAIAMTGLIDQKYFEKIMKAVDDYDNEMEKRGSTTSLKDDIKALKWGWNLNPQYYNHYRICRSFKGRTILDLARDPQNAKFPQNAIIYHNLVNQLHSLKDIDVTITMDASQRNIVITKHGEPSPTGLILPPTVATVATRTSFLKKVVSFFFSLK